MKYTYKKLSLFLAVAVTLLTICIPACAVEENAKVPETMTGYLTADDGTVVEVTGQLIAYNAPRTFSLSDETAATYRYSFATTDYTLDAHGQDGAFASDVYLTIYYRTKTDVPEYLLTKVSGYWEINTHDTVVESAYLSYSCTSMDTPPVRQEVIDKAVNNHFSINTGFSTYINVNGFGGLGAELTLNYLMGTTRRWSFTLVNNRLS